MEKIKIDDLNVGDSVLVTSYNPPLEGVVQDMYNVSSGMITDNRVRSKYPEKVPMVEVTVNGKLMSFVKDVIKKN